MPILADKSELHLDALQDKVKLLQIKKGFVDCNNLRNLGLSET